MELFCLHIDGTLTFTFNLIAEILESSFQNEEKKEGFQTQILGKLQSNPPAFILTVNAEIRVETSFLLLTILNHLVKKRPELM